MVYSVKIKIRGYHGTYPAYIQSIKINNFRESKNDKWFGDAAYFFVEGISSETPESCAAQYAKDKAWNKQLQKYDYTDYIVLEAEIKVNNDKLLDLTIDQGMQLFNKYRDTYLDKIKEGGLKISNKPTDIDILDTMRNNLGIEFVKANVYIRFAFQRRQNLQSRLPNVTIFAVNNPAKNIIKATIKEISGGSIV